MNKMTEVDFVIETMTMCSEFGFYWYKNENAKEHYIVDIEGYFEVDGSRRQGEVSIEATEYFNAVDDNCQSAGGDFKAQREQYNIGKLELRTKNPRAYIQSSTKFVNHLWDTYITDKYQIRISFHVEDTVLQAREVEKISLSINKLEPEKKRGFFG